MVRHRKRHRSEVAQTVARYREAAGLTQEMLADLAGVSRWTITRLEASTHAPTLETLARVALVLGVDLPCLTDAALSEVYS
jgi:DNA-binding XRE family transcriptional regulator